MACNFTSLLLLTRSLYAIAVPKLINILAVPSVCLSVCMSLTFVQPTQPVEIFGNFSLLFGGTLAIH